MFSSLPQTPEAFLDWTWSQYEPYYRDLAHLPPNLRVQVNFDHPNSLETELLVEHLKRWRQGHPIGIIT